LSCSDICWLPKHHGKSHGVDFQPIIQLHSFYITIQTQSDISSRELRPSFHATDALLQRPKFIIGKERNEKKGARHSKYARWIYPITTHTPKSNRSHNPFTAVMEDIQQTTLYYATHYQKHHDSRLKTTRDSKSTTNYNTMTCMTFINEKKQQST